MALEPLDLRSEATGLEELRQLDALRQQGVLTEEEFEAGKARLLRATPSGTSTAGGQTFAPPLLFLAGSLVVLLIAVIGAAMVFSSRSKAADNATGQSIAVTTGANTVSISAPVPASFTSAQLAAAFASLYPHGGLERPADGALELAPKRLIAVDGAVLALISTATLNGGQEGGACHTCAGSLRIDYLRWDNGSFNATGSTAKRFEEPGGGWGEPPAWRLAKTPGLPIVIVTTTELAQGCSSEVVSSLKLTVAGVVKTTGVRKEDCSLATEVPPSGAGS